VTDTGTTERDMQSITALKSLIRKLNRTGVSYADLCALVPDSYGWNDGALKQFIIRPGIPRVSEKLIALAVGISKAVSTPDFTRQIELDFETAKEVEALHDLVKASFTRSAKLLTTLDVHGVLRTINKKSAGIHLPKKFAFARYSVKNQHLVLMEVATELTEVGYVFTMKSEGASGLRTITIGEVLHTVVNTYFSGVSFHVTKSMSKGSFLDLNPLKSDQFNETVSKNEIGMEFFAISNLQIADEIAPATFTGLSGSGTPISGVGITIVGELFNDLGISNLVPASIKASDANKKLSTALTTLMAKSEMIDIHKRAQISA
jgi:hypothetical protein